jgi:hypothetical protein
MSQRTGGNPGQLSSDKDRDPECRAEPAVRGQILGRVVSTHTVGRAQDGSEPLTLVPEMSALAAFRGCRTGLPPRAQSATRKREVGNSVRRVQWDKAQRDLATWQRLMDWPSCARNRNRRKRSQSRQCLRWDQLYHRRICSHAQPSYRIPARSRRSHRSHQPRFLVDSYRSPCRRNRDIRSTGSMPRVSRNQPLAK